MKYRLYQDVTLEQICGRNLLIACGNARKRFDYVRELNDTGADVLKIINEGKNIEDIIGEISRQYEVDDKDIRTGILRFLNELESIGYVLPVTGGIE